MQVRAFVPDIPLKWPIFRRQPHQGLPLESGPFFSPSGEHRGSAGWLRRFPLLKHLPLAAAISGRFGSMSTPTSQVCHCGCGLPRSLAPLLLPRFADRRHAFSFSLATWRCRFSLVLELLPPQKRNMIRWKFLRIKNSRRGNHSAFPVIQ
jgi:hypothetical protein